MKDVERLFWALGLLLLLPFAVQHGFRLNSLAPSDAASLQSSTFGYSNITENKPTMWNAVYETRSDHEYSHEHKKSKAGFQPSTYSPPQVVKQVARLSVPTLRIDLPVVAGRGSPGSHHVEVITAGDLDSGKHIALATCFEGDAQALAQRIRGEWLFLQTDSRLRQYRVIEVRRADPDSPSLPSPAFHSITLVTCFPGYDQGQHLFLVTAIEVSRGGNHLSTAVSYYPNHLKF